MGIWQLAKSLAVQPRDVPVDSSQKAGVILSIWPDQFSFSLPIALKHTLRANDSARQLSACLA
jgi:hypothetical protein